MDREIPAAPTPPPLALPGDGAVPSTSRSAVYLECLEQMKCSPPGTPPATPSTSSGLPPAPPCYRPRQSLREEEIADLINQGSDGDSDESEDDDVAATVPMISRVMRVQMTPWDQDDDDDDREGGAGAAPPADAVPAADAAFEWREFPNSPISPELRRETFSQISVGPTSPHVDPYDIFVAIWDRQLMENIASETNRYAQQVCTQLWDNHNLCPNSRVNHWYDTSADELYVYLALLLAMGLVVKTRLEDYWVSTSDIFSTPGFSAHMSRNRFIILNKFLHFVNNEDMCALNLEDSEARLFKIRPLLSHLNLKFLELYIPSQNIVLDESLLMWKGWLDISQLIPNKAANKGIKTYEICESRTGYLWRFEVHVHSKSTPKPPESENLLERTTPAIVLRLTQGLEHKGYTLWMDNFYNSPLLARRLKSLGFDCAGILRTDRQYLPEALHSLSKGRMRKGQVAGLTSGDVDVMVWRDINRVAMISTYHGNAVRTIHGSTKPILIHDYNTMMGGVDRKDQLLSMYPVERKRTKVWYKKLFRRLLNVSVLNSYIIHHQNASSSSFSSAVSHRKFRISLIKSILSKHRVSSSSSIVQPTPNFVDLAHRPAFYPKRSGQRARRKCVVCKKLTQMFCVGCNKSICLDPCFLSLHNYVPI